MASGTRARLVSLFLGTSAALLLWPAPTPTVVSAQTASTLWTAGAAPAVVDAGPDGAVEVGVKFRSDVSGQITGIRFYKAATNTGSHVGNLWSRTGTRLATATFTGESASGWQQVAFAKPVSIAANTVYVASYHTNVGHYADDQNYFAGKGVDTPPLHALADGVSGANGVYAYGSSSRFPSTGWRSSNYWVDVVFTPSSSPPPVTDTTPPTVTAFTLPTTSSTLAVTISSFTATDNVGVTGYLVTESAAAPSSAAAGWSSAAQKSYTFATAGAKTLYGWAKDAAGNVSASRSAGVTITIPPPSNTGPEPAGWYAGDLHMHRSCGGPPESLSSIYNGMGAQNLASVSLLADMGNGEVQNPSTDLPQVNGQDASVSTPGRIVHWDAEWHWDATYTQYAHRALGGHVLALGLSQAQQLWQEYTYPILNWARQQGGIAGFAHMQYLESDVPQNLTCCTPIEYPVEIALGAADFITEDIDDNNSGFPMYPENAIAAYYKLLNTGFRPGLTAGTDYPCNASRPLGSLLTYAQVAGGQMTYRNWLEAVRTGRTVISRNGHREFLNLMVNGAAGPGDEIRLAGGGTVPVIVDWTASQNLSGTIELVNNGAVVATLQASVAAGAPARLTAAVTFSKSGWLAARRMGADGHQVHTAAVFVLVDNAPIRASAADAQFYVRWMDNLITRTSPGGAWSSFFPTSRAQAQARYQAAKAVFEQIAAEAAGTTPPPDPGGSASLFTAQVPTQFENDARYELGTRFWSDVNGTITQVRVYTHAAEGGAHTVRVWQVSGAALVAGPFTWNITAGTEGWKTFSLPAPVAITANTQYIVAIANSTDNYYAEQVQGLASAVVSGHLHADAGSGVYATTLGTMPGATWQNTNYFRDVVFAPE